MMKDSANPYDDLLSWMKRNHINGDEEQRLRYLIDRIHEWKNSSRPEFQLRQNSESFTEEDMRKCWYKAMQEMNSHEQISFEDYIQSAEFKDRPEVEQETK